jgi:hypothetical protein
VASAPVALCIDLDATASTTAPDPFLPLTSVGATQTRRCDTPPIRSAA